MTDTDIMLVDAVIESVLKDNSIAKNFASAAAQNDLTVVSVAEKMNQVRQLESKLKEMSRAQRRYRLLKIISKLMREDTTQNKGA